MNAPLNSPDIKRTADGYQFGNLLATGLPPAQSRTLLLRARGISVEAAADFLGCSTQNIKQQMRTLFFKMDCGNAPALVTRAFESGVLRVLSLMLSCYLSLFGAITDDDARRTRRDPPRNATRLARRNAREPHLLLWDESENEFLRVYTDLNHA